MEERGKGCGHGRLWERRLPENWEMLCGESERIPSLRSEEGRPGLQDSREGEEASIMSHDSVP